MDAAALCLVHQIDTDANVWGDLQDLKRQIEISLQAGRVANDQHLIVTPEADGVSGNALLGGMRKQGIGAG